MKKHTFSEENARKSYNFLIHLKFLLIGFAKLLVSPCGKKTSHPPCGNKEILLIDSFFLFFFITLHKI